MKRLIWIFLVTTAGTVMAQSETALDRQVKKFLNDHRNSWQDLNVPYQDGQLLYDLIVKNGYTAAVEIGTSTGHSTIWIAWAMSKTGGKVTTLEIDAGRRQQALDNLKQCGLLEYVDSQLGDAHALVKELKGPIDFVFSDADKDWYVQYFKDLDPKLKAGGCFTAHNVRNNFGGTKDFVDYVQSLKSYETTIDKSSSAGVSISYKRK
jgi:predicted O-methyltransferase YrrM